MVGDISGPSYLGLTPCTKKEHKAAGCRPKESPSTACAYPLVTHWLKDVRRNWSMHSEAERAEPSFWDFTYLLALLRNILQRRAYLLHTCRPTHIL